MSNDKSETVILINESRRAHSLPSRPEPTEASKLGARGRPRATGMGELDRGVKMYRPPLLEVGARIEVPVWYFEELRKIKAMRATLGKRDGVAVGRSRSEAAQAAAAAREAELVESTRTARESAAAADARAAQADAEVARAREIASKNAETLAAQEVELKKLRAELEAAKKREAKAEKADDKPKS